MRRKPMEEAGFEPCLNKLLNEMPLEEASPDFTDRVMRAITLPERSPRQADAGKQHWRSQAVNGLIAIAATVLFIQSGLIDKVLSIDTGINMISAYIAQLSHLLQS